MAKRRGAQFWRGHIEAWDRSELTQEAYCAAHGLNIRSFYRWRHKQSEAAVAAKSSLTLVPVSVDSPARAGGLRVRSPGGWQIEVPADAPASWLGELLRQLP